LLCVEYEGMLIRLDGNCVLIIFVMINRQMETRCDEYGVEEQVEVMKPGK